MVDWVRKLILKSEFNRNVAKLVTGTASANIITVIFLPILARVYSVEDFGYFQQLLSLIMIFSTISCLKYEMAIPLPESKEDSDNIFVVALFSLIILTGVLFIFLNKFGDSVLSIYSAEHLFPYRHWVIFGVLSAGSYELMNYVFTREKAFGKIAKYRVAQVSMIQVLALGYGFYSPEFQGLLISYILGNGLIAIWMIYNSPISIRSIRISRIRLAVIQYKKFPLINSPMVLINSFSIQLPVFMLSAYFSPEIVGYYMMANRMITMPMNLISRSVGRVYYKEASDSLHKSSNTMLKTFKQTVKRVAKLGIIPTVIVIFFAPILVTWLLGEQWVKAGVFMQIMMPWLFFQFVNLPVSTTFSVINRQEIGFILIVTFTFLKYLAMNFWNYSPVHQLIALTVVSSIFYFMYTTTSYYAVRKLK